MGFTRLRRGTNSRQSAASYQFGWTRWTPHRSAIAARMAAPSRGSTAGGASGRSMLRRASATSVPMGAAWPASTTRLHRSASEPRAPVAARRLSLAGSERRVLSPRRAPGPRARTPVARRKRARAWTDVTSRPSPLSGARAQPHCTGRRGGQECARVRHTNRTRPVWATPGLRREESSGLACGAGANRVRPRPVEWARVLPRSRGTSSSYNYLYTHTCRYARELARFVIMAVPDARPAARGGAGHACVR
jgi:hypothetical protein